MTAVATTVMVIGRVTADADQPTLAESLSAIASSQGLYALSGAGRLVSGVTLVAAAWYLARTWIIRERLGTPIVPALFALSGVFTAASGALAITLGSLAPEVAPSVSRSPRWGLAEGISDLRWLTGKVGFVLAGLALIIAARYQRKVGGLLKYLAPVSAVVGLAMQVIWLDSATSAHRIIGAAFFVWLIAIGTMLVTGRTEKLFARLGGRQPGTLLRSPLLPVWVAMHGSGLWEGSDARPPLQDTAMTHVYAALGVQAAPCGCRSEFTTAIWGVPPPRRAYESCLGLRRCRPACS